MEIDKDIDELCRHDVESVLIKVPYVLYSGMEIPVKESESERKFRFKQMTLKDSMETDRFSYNIVLNGIFDSSGTDYNLYRYLLLRRTLLSIDDKTFKRKNGWMEKEDWEVVRKMSGPIVLYALGKYEDSFVISDLERGKLEKESAILYGSKNGKILDPSPGLSMTCTLESLWDKFGLTKSDIENMPLKEYSKIKIILMKEAERMNNG